MSRLNYAPKLKEIRVTDIKQGLGVFTPQPDKPVSFAALKEALKKAGYTLDAADITAAGVLQHDDAGWWLVAEPTGQRFALEGAGVEKLLAGSAAGARVELVGDWKTSGVGDTARETISPRAVKKAEGAAKTVAAMSAPPFAGQTREATAATFVNARFDYTPQAWLAIPIADSLSPTSAKTNEELLPPRASDSSVASTRVAPARESELAPAPIRTTSPGLTVFKGGALTPRLFLVEQHLGNLSVSRQILQLSASYTPSPRVQLEVEAPLVSRTSFDDGARRGSGTSLGNVTLWGKYRFYRTVKTYGDRQAALRVGAELPTGKAAAPSVSEVNAPAFVRQQLTPISGGFAPHFELAFSQAGGRFIFGGDIEGVLRTERDGFRTGHEARADTDLEYVLLPFKYESPGHELFLIVETSFIHRGTGRLGGAEVAGSKSTEFYVAPGLQYAAHPRFVVEASVQLPVVRNTGALVLRTDRNVLLGVKYLF
ncbi:MAG: hypothetical protein ACJ741_02335 [Pyrinomonadaceae bacterium]